MMNPVAVVGGGIAGLTAAWELARAGCEVDLYEASGRLGGALAPLTLAGVRVDAGAESFATRTLAVREFIEAIHLDGVSLGDQLIDPNPAGAWLQLPETVGPLPATGILGIPAEPQAQDVAHLIGAEAAARAAEDLQAPMSWQPGQRPSVGAVVRERMGDAVAEKLTAPITSGVYSSAPDDLDLATASPGLYEAMLREGSLARAVAAQKAKSPAGSAVQSLRGGIHRVVDALEQQLRAAGVRIHLNTPLRTVAELDAVSTVLALDAPTAADLSADSVPDLPQIPPMESRGVALVALLIDAPELDAQPRGTGMLVAPGVEGISAKAMTHISSKWSWVAETLAAQLGQGHHILRLSYGRVTDAGGEGLGYHSTDEQLFEAAASDLSRLFGHELPAERILDRAVIRWQRALPAAIAGSSSRIGELEQTLTAQNIYPTGAWFAGTGLARVIPHARATAQAAAHGVLSN